MIRKEIKAKILLVILLLLGAGFGVYRLTESPPTWLDEGMIVQLAINLAEHGVIGMQSSPGSFVSGAYTSSGFPVFLPLAGFFKIAGVGLLQARILMIFWMLLLVAACFVYVLRLYGMRSAFFAGLLLVTFAPLYGNGKNVLGEIPGLTLFFLFLLIFHRVEKENFSSKPLLFFIGGFTLGLFVATKVIFILALGAFAAAVVWTQASRGVYGFSELHLRKLLFFITGAVFPLIVWFFTQFSSSDSFQNVLTFYRNPYSLDSVFSVMAVNFVRFFRELSPLYMVFLFGIWGISLIMREREKRGLVSLSEKVVFTFSFIVLFFYLRTPGWYRYFFPAQILALVHFPSALFYLIGFLEDRINQWRSDFLKLTATVVLLGLVVFQAYQIGFASWVAESYKSTRTEELRTYFSKWDPVQNLFIYNAPEIVIFLPKNSIYYQFLESNKRVLVGQAELERLSRENFADAVVLIADESGNYLVDLFPGYQIKDRVDRYIVLTAQKSNGQ